MPIGNLPKFCGRTALSSLLITDSDPISDGDEIHVYGTYPWAYDSDFDGVGDYREIFVIGTDPGLADTDRDGWSDGQELFTYHTDPNDYDSYPVSQGRRR